MTAEGIRQQSAEQVFKVISQKAASPPHAVGSEFQTFSPSGANAHPSGTPQSASAPYRCCPLPIRFEYRPSDISRHVLVRPLFAIKIASLSSSVGI